MFAFKFFKSQNKCLPYFEYATAKIKKYANTTIAEPYLLRYR